MSEPERMADLVDVGLVRIAVEPGAVVIEPGGADIDGGADDVGAVRAAEGPAGKGAAVGVVEAQLGRAAGAHEGDVAHVLPGLQRRQRKLLAGGGQAIDVERDVGPGATSVHVNPLVVLDTPIAEPQIIGDLLVGIGGAGGLQLAGRAAFRLSSSRVRPRDDAAFEISCGRERSRPAQGTHLLTLPACAG